MRLRRVQCSFSWVQPRNLWSDTHHVHTRCINDINTELRAGTETSVMQLVCFSWVGFSVWEFSADAALESSCSTQTRPSLVLLVCRWRGAPAGTNEFVCVGQRSSRPSKLDQLVSVGHTCAESRVCVRQTFTLCVCFSQTPAFAGWTHKPLDPCWALLDSDWSGRNERTRPLKRMQLTNQSISGRARRLLHSALIFQF